MVNIKNLLVGFGALVFFPLILAVFLFWMFCYIGQLVVAELKE